MHSVLKMSHVPTEDKCSTSWGSQFDNTRWLKRMRLKKKLLKGNMICRKRYMLQKTWPYFDEWTWLTDIHLGLQKERFYECIWRPCCTTNHAYTKMFLACSFMIRNILRKYFEFWNCFISFHFRCHGSQFFCMNQIKKNEECQDRPCLSLSPKKKISAPFSKEKILF